MIYRLYAGAENEIKERIIQAAFILSLTAGFPSLAAYLNREVFVPRPTTITQDDSPGVVLGSSDAESSSSPDSSSPPPTDPGTPAATPVAGAERTSALGRTNRATSTSTPTTSSSPQSTASVNPSPSLPEGGMGGGTEDPTPPTSDPDPTPQVTAEANVLDMADASITVSPEGASADVSIDP